MALRDEAGLAPLTVQVLIDVEHGQAFGTTNGENKAKDPEWVLFHRLVHATRGDVTFLWRPVIFKPS